jgi:hypothetical protein
MALCACQGMTAAHGCGASFWVVCPQDFLEVLGDYFFSQQREMKTFLSTKVSSHCSTRI